MHEKGFKRTYRVLLLPNENYIVQRTGSAYWRTLREGWRGLFRVRQFERLSQANAAAVEWEDRTRRREVQVVRTFEVE